MNNWWIYKGTGEPHDDIERLPVPPSWRQFESRRDEQHLGKDARGAKFQVGDQEKDLINAALYLRRPLFVTGKPGSGKSSLAYAVAYELKLGPVLHWSITTRVTLKDGLYHYDAIGRLQDAALAAKRRIAAPDIGQYLRLGSLGTALLPTKRPRVLLIDEIDKSDIDLPNDLLNIFEEGEYDIPELARISKQSNQVAVMPYDGKCDDDKVLIEAGHVRCYAFPLVILTSNGEREFPPAFLRRCLRMDMQFPDRKKLTNIVKAHLGDELSPQALQLIENFDERSKRGDLATDQLLNAIYLTTHGKIKLSDKEKLFASLWKYLTSTDAEEA